MAKYSMNYFVKTAASLLLCCFSSHCVHAQNKEIDSLRKILPRAPAIERIKINYFIGTELLSSLPDSAIRYLNEALSLSQEMNNDTLAAKCLNKIGILKFNSGEYEIAVGNLYNALRIFERYKDKPRAMRCLQYLGMAYNEQGMYDKALDFAKQSLEISRAIGDSTATGVSMTNIGSVYYAQSDYDKALDYFQQALQTMEALRDKQGVAEALNNVAVIYEQKKNFGKALEYHLRSLALAKETGDSRGIAASYHNIGLVYKGMKKTPVAIRYLDSCITLAKEGNDKSYLKDSYNTLSELYSDIGNFEKAYQTHLLFSQLNDTLMNEENKRQFAEMNTKYETEKKDNQISLLNKDSEKQKIIRNALMGGFAIVLLFAAVFLHQRNKIKKGKQRSDELLLNILPSETAEELKATGTTKAKHFDGVTVLFTDFRNFTALSEKLSAQELVNEIDYYYSAFDDIISKHNIEKIKTIGDSYMCASGLPVANKTNAEDTVRAALEIRDFTVNEKHKRKAEGKPYFEIRIGCNTGSVVAGIVGTKKFAYDIWGDTVNIASRMESSGETNKVNISGNTYQIVKDKFSCQYRGKIEAKNKGLIDMYFVEAAL